MNYNEIDVTNELLQFIVDIQEVQKIFSLKEIDIRELERAMEVCERNSYFRPEDLYSKSKEDLSSKGFSEVCIQAILKCIERQREIELQEQFSNTGANGTPENPEIMVDRIRKMKFFSMFKRDLLYGLSVVSVDSLLAGIQRVLNTTFTPFLTPKIHTFQSIIPCFQCHDVILCTTIVSIQCGLSLYQWFYGDITGKQLKKNVAVSISTAAGALIGFFGGAALGAVLGSLCPVVGNVLGAFIGGVIGGIMGCFAFDVTSRVLTEYIWPDDIVEDINAKRQIVDIAYKNLKCDKDTPDDQVRKKYYEEMRLWRVNNDDTPEQRQHCLMIIASYEVIKTYHHTIREAYKVLGLEEPTTEELVEKKWNENKDKAFRETSESSATKKEPSEGITKKKYEQMYLILRQHVKERYNTPKNFIREFLTPTPAISLVNNTQNIV